MSIRKWLVAGSCANVGVTCNRYMCKGDEGSKEFAKLFKVMMGDAPADTPIKTIVRRQMIKICGGDYPRGKAANPASFLGSTPARVADRE